MKITIECEGQKIELTSDMFEQFMFSMPRDVHRLADNRLELGHAHFVVGGQLKPGVKPRWGDA